MKYLLLLLSFNIYAQREIRVEDYLCLPCSEYEDSDSEYLTNTFDWSFADPMYPNGLLRIKIMHNDSLSFCKDDISIEQTNNVISLIVNLDSNQRFKVLNNPKENCRISIFELTNIQKIENLYFQINSEPTLLKDHRLLIGDTLGLVGSFSKKEGFMFTSFGSSKRHWNGNIIQSHNNLSEIRSRRYYFFYANGKPKKVEYFLFGYGTYRAKHFRRNGKVKKDEFKAEVVNFCECN